MQYLAVNFGFMSRSHRVAAVHYVVLSAAGEPLILSTGGSPTYNITGPAAPFLDEKCSYKASSWLVDGLNLAATYTYTPFGWAEASRLGGHGCSTSLGPAGTAVPGMHSKP